MPRHSPLEDEQRRSDLLILIREGVHPAVAAKQVGSSYRAILRYDTEGEFGEALKLAIEEGRARDAMQDADGSVIRTAPRKRKRAVPEPPPIPPPQPPIWVSTEGFEDPVAGPEPAIASAGRAPTPSLGSTGSAPVPYSREAARDLAWARWLNADGSVDIRIQMVAGRQIQAFATTDARIEAARRHLLDVERVRAEAERARLTMSAESAPDALSTGGTLQVLEIPSNGTEAPGYAPIPIRAPIDAEVVSAAATGTEPAE
jgi:hypothetical protein